MISGGKEHEFTKSSFENMEYSYKLPHLDGSCEVDGRGICYNSICEGSSVFRSNSEFRKILSLPSFYAFYTIDLEESASRKLAQVAETQEIRVMMVFDYYAIALGEEEPISSTLPDFPNGCKKPNLRPGAGHDQLVTKMDGLADQMNSTESQELVESSSASLESIVNVNRNLNIATLVLVATTRCRRAARGGLGSEECQMQGKGGYPSM